MGRVVDVVTHMANWKRGSVHRRILTAAAVVAFFTFLAKLTGAAREVFVARYFGVSDEVDAFALAVTLPYFAIAIFGGALNSALIPTYVDVRQREGRDAAKRLLSTVLLLAIGLLVIVAIALVVLVPTVLPLVASRFAGEKLRLTFQLSYILIPSVVVAGTTMTLTAVLNANERFAPGASASLAIPVISILALLLFGRMVGIRALAVGVFLGYCVESLLVLRAVRRQGLVARPRWGGVTPALRRLAGQYLPMLAGGLVMGTNPVIDSLMASQLDPGSVAALSYGNKLVAFGMGVGAMSLSSAVFPHFSRMASNCEWDRLGKMIRTYAGASLAITIPVTAGAMLLSESAADTIQVGRVQALYLAQIPFHLTGLIFVKFVSATAGNRVLMWMSVLSCVVNVVGNVVFSRMLGAPGIALSTSVVYAVTFTITGLVTMRRLRVLRRQPARETAVTIHRAT
jgi:putative peptidoglycan lipid II flippase